MTGINWIPEEPDNPDYIENMQRAVLNTEYMVLMNMLEKQEVVWGSSRLAMTIKALEDIGGVPEIEKSEDFALTGEVIKQYKSDNGIVFLSNVCVQTTFRARDDNPDGFDSSAISRKFSLDTDYDPLKNLYKTVWDIWFSGKLHALKNEGVPASKAALQMSKYFESIADGLDTNKMDELMSLENYSDIDRWIYDFEEDDNSPFPLVTGPELVSYSVGFILYNELPDDEYSRLDSILQDYFQSEKEVALDERKRLGEQTGYLDVGVAFEDSVFRVSKVLLAGLNIFLQEAIATNNLPETKKFWI